MKKCAVIIGVNKTGGLPILSAAVSGANDFAKWAKSQGFETTLLTDEREPVTVSSIKAAIKEYVNVRNYSQIIIYFAGHGILKGPNDEYWLLSGAPDDVDEAVNVSASRFLAFNSGISHVVIISDACRTTPSNPLITQISGGVIFPNMLASHQQPDIDTFFATKPGSSAYEVRDETIAANNYKGIFTHCMLEGLKGNVPEVIRSLDSSNEDVAVVFPYELKKYLERRVPIAAEEISIKLIQDPRIEVSSRPPSYLSRIASLEIAKGGFDGNKDRFKPAMESKMNQEINLVDSNLFDIKQTLNASGNATVSIEIDKELEKLTRSNGRVGFETKTGFSIIGSEDFEIELDRGHYDIFSEDENKHVRLYPNENTTTLLFIGADGTGTPLAVLPGFIGTITVENNKVVNVNYIPSVNTPRYNEFMIRNHEVTQRRAAAALAARHGSFKISGNRYAILGTASYLRNDKALDPTLGLYAAYAYAEAGNKTEIESIYDYMVAEPEAILFDVKLLASLNGTLIKGLEKTHAPFCPMLSQGWSYLPINEIMYNSELKKFSQFLIPGLWTTFTKQGIQLIKESFLK